MSTSHQKPCPGARIRRRAFLQSAAALGVWAALPAPAAPSQPIKIGFLGLAHSHALGKFRIAHALPGLKLVGVAEGSPAVRSRFEKLGAKILSRDQLLAAAEIVVIESAVRHHARDARDALEAGRHVHVEKPPAATLREMKLLVRLAQEKKRLLQVGYMWRYNPGFIRVMEAARQGWLGDVYLVRATMNTQIDAAQRHEWAEFKGGAMFEQGCHLIDAVTRLMGRPTRVTPHLQRRGEDDLADNCIAIFEYPKAQAIITNASLHPNAGPHRFLEILGTNGVARVQPIEPPNLSIDLAQAAGPYAAGLQKVELPPYQRYENELVDLANAVRENKPLAVSPADELLTHETLLRACAMH